MAQDKILYSSKPPPKEGDLYGRVNVAGRIFEVFYGHYEEFERGIHDPIPLYPDLLREPVYTEDGFPIVTGMQNTCVHYDGQKDGDSCIECIHFQREEDLFGLCGNFKNRHSLINK